MDSVEKKLAAILNRTWWVLLLRGLVAIAFGVLTWFQPGSVAAIRLRKEIEGELWLILGGFAAVVFGVLLVAQPEAGALALLRLIAVFAFVYGVPLALLAFKARSFGNQAASS